MSVRYQPFESKSGFLSPGFSVNENGDLTVSGNINTTGSFKINGIPIIDPSDSVIGLDPVIQRALGLTQIGTLEYLNIDGDLRISQGSSPYFSVFDGMVEIESIPAPGRIDNMEIGLRVPAVGNFTSLNVGPGDSTGELTVQGNIFITNTPSLPLHATTKTYVDARVSAFAIAFGA
jgi:hypothetical protein